MAEEQKIEEEVTDPGIIGSFDSMVNDYLDRLFEHVDYNVRAKNQLTQGQIRKMFSRRFSEDIADAWDEWYEDTTFEDTEEDEDV